MRYTHSLKEAVKLAMGAMKRMASLKIPPNPQNYAVWYAYLSGHDAAFVSQVDGMLTNKAPFDEAQCADLYAALVRSDDEFVDDARDAALYAVGSELERAIAQAKEILSKAGDDTERYGKTLQGVDGVLQAADSAEQLRSVVANLITQTRRMAEQNRTANERLEQSNQEIADLKMRIADIRNDALTDPLTGLANRRAFDERIAADIDEAVLAETSLSLLMLDIDHFKAFNDTYGHQLGDEVLRLVADCINANTKGRDTTARFGGEEFAVILPMTDLEGALKLAEQIREIVAGKRIARKGSGRILGSITLSIGAAAYRPGEGAEDLIARADAALYAAKRGGRNRVETERCLGADDPGRQNVA